MRLTPTTGGALRFHGTDFTHHKGKALQDFRRNVQMVFQDPQSRSTRASASSRSSVPVSGCARPSRADGGPRWPTC